MSPIIAAERPLRASLRFLLLPLLLSISCGGSGVSHSERATPPPLRLPKSWQISAPLLAPPRSGEILGYSEPAPAHCGKHWHLFCTRTESDGSRSLAHFRVEDWSSPLKPLPIPALESFRGSPQILYWEPLAGWLLLYTTDDSEGDPQLRFTLLSGLDPPTAREPSRAIPFEITMEGARDFWLIAEATSAHLFFTSSHESDLVLHMETSLEDFPSGWSDAEPAIRGDVTGPARIYSAPNGYLAIVEAHFQWRRYYKAYRSEDLSGPWRPQAVTRVNPFLGLASSEFQGDAWTDTFRDGQILPSEGTSHLPVDLPGLQILFHGSSYGSRDGRKPFQIPWKIGLARAVP